MKPVAVINVAGLTAALMGDSAPRLKEIASGYRASVGPVLPAVTCPVQATYLTGLAPRDHGVNTEFVNALKELGYPRFNARQWYGVFAPAGTPREIVARLNETIRQSLAAPDLRDPLAAIGADVFVLSPEEFGAFVKGEIERWGVIIKKYGIKLEQ